MSASKSSYEPRPEAEVVAWQNLTEDQRDAVNGAHGYFSRMADIADGAKKRETSGLAELDIFLPHIDEERRNHVVLIDGERGTGKTAVMLRLLVDWSAAVRGKLREDIESTEHGKSPVTVDSAIVPVGLLDLQALSPKAMLGLHLAGHLQRVVEAMERRTSKSTKSAPWAPGESEELQSRKAWQKFLSAAAAAWDGNLKERQGKIDPEAYVIELEHAERERLEIGGTFRAFVDALVEDYDHQFHPKKKPFFVITIDDADLNPQRTTEIFELIRVLWHPRVGFLIAGDGDLFVTVLEEHFKRAIEMPKFYGGGFGEGPVQAYFEHAEDAKKLARDAYRKAIPPAQRYPTGLRPAERYKKIADVLAEIPTCSSAPSSMLDMRDYFVHDAELMNALPVRIRNLLDLAGYIRREKPSPIHVAWKLWQEAWGHADLLHDLQNKEFVQLKQARRAELFQFSNELKWTPEPTEQRAWKLRDDINVVVNEGVRFEFSNDKFQLPPSLISSYQLALEVAARENAYSNRSPVLAAMRSRPEAIRLQFLSNGTQTGAAMWYLPLWTSFRDYSLFFNTWRRIIYDTLSQNDGSVGLDLLARQYLDICLNSVAPELTENDAQIEIAMSPEGQTTWASLAARVVQIIRRDSPHRDETVRMWVVMQACSLAAPEYGLSAAAANEWLHALRDAFGDDWERRRDMLKSNRALSSENIKAVEIDKRFSEYQWANVIEDRPTASDLKGNDNAVEFIVGRLNQVPRDGDSLPGRSTPSLGGYVSFGRSALLSKASRAELGSMRRAARNIPSGKNGIAQDTVKKLWDAAIDRGSDVANLLQWDNTISGIILARNLLFEVGPIQVDGNIVEPIVSETLPSGQPFSFVSMKADWTQKLKAQLTPSADFLLRIAWDSLVDYQDDSKRRAEMTSISKIWLGAAFRISTNSTNFYWPMADWPALIDWENFVDSWNREVQVAEQMLMPGDSTRTQSVVDALAYWFVYALNVSTRPTGAAAIQFVGAHNWTTIGKNLQFRSDLNSGDKSTTGAHADACNDWWHRVIVMAAPEMGLSQEAAGGLLDGLFDKEGNKNRPTREKSDAHQIRHQHAIDCGIDPDQVDAILAQIDNDNPDHPWHKFFAPEKA